MREILFRGKRTDDGKWVMGFYLFDKFDHYIESYSIDENAHGVLYPYPQTDEVIPETVGQYTGLTDKVGKKIFEGDIVRCRGADYDRRAAMVGQIVFCDCCFYVDSNKSYDMTAMELCDRFEVVGNIHDNPELLEVSEDG